MSWKPLLQGQSVQVVQTAWTSLQQLGLGAREQP
jgi:hypothetical protein